MTLVILVVLRDVFTNNLKKKMYIAILCDVLHDYIFCFIFHWWLCNNRYRLHDREPYLLFPNIVNNGVLAYYQQHVQVWNSLTKYSWCIIRSKIHFVLFESNLRKYSSKVSSVFLQVIMILYDTSDKVFNCMTLIWH